MKEKKDILFLCQYFYPEYVSSATLPYDTAKALVEEGFSVSALCGYPKEYSKKNNVKKKERHEGIEIKRLNYLQLKRSNSIGRLINYFSFTFAVFLNFIYLRNFKTIVVYSNPPVLPLVAAWASKLFGIKMVFVSYDVYPEMAYITNSISKDGFISKMMTFINKRIYKNVHRVVALSTEMKEYLLNNRESLKAEQVVVIPNWYEDNPNKNVSKSYLNERFSSLNPEINLIVSYFGNLGICQDIETILESIRALKDNNEVKFLFAGHGNKMDYLKDIVANEDLNNVVIFDFLHGEDFKDALNISDCFLVSLEKGLTGLAVPSKTYSYMMAGKPVIAIMGTNSDISRDLVENKAGFALEVGEVERLVNVINELSEHQDLREEMGLNIYNLFRKKYTTEKSTSKYVEMIKAILEV